MKNLMFLWFLCILFDSDGQQVQVQGNLNISTVPTDNTISQILGVDASGNVLKKALSTFPVNDADSDPTNELQDINVSASGDTLRLSGDDFWIIPGISAANWAIDGSGNKYRIAKIGTQTWLRSNLRTTKFNDGTNITNVTSNGSWAGWTAPAYCWYQNNQALYEYPYGALYNNYVTNTTFNGGKNVCPIGYHIPSETEVLTLKAFLGTNSGGKLKQIGLTYWFMPNTGATDSFLFTGIPTGFRDPTTGAFSSGINIWGEFWTTTLSSSAVYKKGRLTWNDSDLTTTTADQKQGIPLRCLKD
jgi:uncharacterized protein (TIGR02145 family)